MKSKMSFFNGTLFRKNLQRFAPLWALLLASMVITGPVALMTNLAQDWTEKEFRVEMARSYLQYLTQYGCVVGAIFALLCAAACFSYLHKARSAYMMHAFPMTRDCHFVTNTVSCLAFAIVPYLVVTLLNLLVLAFNGLEQLGGEAMLVLAKWVLQYLCFIGMAVFCMHLTGNTVIGALSYVALSFIGWALPALLTLTVISPLFYGFRQPAVDYTVLSPVIHLMKTVSPLNNAWIYVYAVLGAALLAAAWLLYRVRHMERAGDAMVYGWARVVFLILFTVMVGLLLGVAFFLILTGGLDPSQRVFLYTFCLLIALFVGYLGARMMLGRTVRVLRSKSFWLGYAAFAAVAVLGVCALKADVLGWQRRVPEEKQIKSVEISTRQENAEYGMGYWGALDIDRITVNDPEGLALIGKMHKAALAERNDSTFKNKAEEDGAVCCTFFLTYHLKNGQTMTRVYEVYNPEAIDCGRTLFSDPDRAAAYYEERLPLRCNEVQMADAEGMIWVTDHPQQVRGAMISDAKAGRLPIVNEFTQTGEEYTMTFLGSEEHLGSFLLSRDAEETAALFYATEDREFYDVR